MEIRDGEGEGDAVRPLFLALWKDFTTSYFALSWRDCDSSTNYEIGDGEIRVYVWEVALAIFGITVIAFIMMRLV